MYTNVLPMWAKMTNFDSFVSISVFSTSSSTVPSSSPNIDIANDQSIAKTEVTHIENCGYPAN